MNIRRLIGGLAFLCIFIGVLLICFIHGGLLNPEYAFYAWPTGVHLSAPLHIVGFISMIVGAVGFVIVFSLRKT